MVSPSRIAGSGPVLLPRGYTAAAAAASSRLPVFRWRWRLRLALPGAIMLLQPLLLLLLLLLRLSWEEASASFLLPPIVAGFAVGRLGRRRRRRLPPRPWTTGRHRAGGRGVGLLPRSFPTATAGAMTTTITITTTTTTAVFLSSGQQRINDDGDEEDEDGVVPAAAAAVVWFDDFGGMTVGGDEDGSSGTTSTSPLLLKDRMGSIREEEARRSQEVADNWREGYWSVRGCKLDPSSSFDSGGFRQGDSSDDDDDDDGDRGGAPPRKTVVTCVRRVPELLNHGEEDDEDGRPVVLVGRSDGSLLWLRVSADVGRRADLRRGEGYYRESGAGAARPDDYLTTFESRVVARPSADGDGGGMTVGVELRKRDDGTSGGRGGSGVDTNEASLPSPSAAFDILAQIRYGPSIRGDDTEGGTAAASILDMLVVVVPPPGRERGGGGGGGNRSGSGTVGREAGLLWIVTEGSPNSIMVLPLMGATGGASSGVLLPASSSMPSSSSSSTSADDEGGRFFSLLPAVHAAPIVAMKAMAAVAAVAAADDVDDGGASVVVVVVSVSEDGRVAVWGVGPSRPDSATTTTTTGAGSSVSLLHECNLFDLDGDGGGNDNDIDNDDNNDVVWSVDVDDTYLYVGRRSGKISIYLLVASQIDGERVWTLTVAKTFVAFSNGRRPGVSALCATCGGIVGGGIGSRVPTRGLVAGNGGGNIKQWDLLPAGDGGSRRLEQWPRLESQRLPGRAHVFRTARRGGDGGPTTENAAILSLLCVRGVVLAADPGGLTAWDPATGRTLYGMGGMEFGGTGTMTVAAATAGSRVVTAAAAAAARPSLVVLDGDRTDDIDRPPPGGGGGITPLPPSSSFSSVLLTNGMDQYLCVHDFGMDRDSLTGMIGGDDDDEGGE